MGAAIHNLVVDGAAILEEELPVFLEAEGAVWASILGEEGELPFGAVVGGDVHEAIVVEICGFAVDAVKSRQMIDFVPTICDLMRIEVPSDPDMENDRGRVDGTSLLPLVRGERDSVRPYSFAENGRFRSARSATGKLIVPKEALEDGGWEQLAAGELSFPGRYFDLTVDADEHVNAFDPSDERVLELFAALKEWSDSMPIGSGMVKVSERDIEHAAVLDALGYGGGVGEDQAEGEEEE